MANGTCCCIGVGPGDPELITVKALRALERCPAVAAPRTRQGKMLALEIASAAMDLSDKEILPLAFPMTYDAEEREAAHAKAAEQVASYLDRGIDVALLTLGDPSVYTTASYVRDRLREKGYATETVAGVPSFCAAAAASQTALAADREELHILPAGVESDFPGTRVFMKAGSRLPNLLRKLESEGLLEQTVLAENIGLPGEKIVRQPTREDAEQAGYFATLIVRDRGNDQ